MARGRRVCLSPQGLRYEYLLFWSSSAHSLSVADVSCSMTRPHFLQKASAVSASSSRTSVTSPPRCHNAAAGSASSQQSQLGFFLCGHQCWRAESRPEVFLVEFILCSLLTYGGLRLRMLSQEQHLGGGAWCRIIKNDGIYKHHCCSTSNHRKTSPSTIKLWCFSYTGGWGHKLAAGVVTWPTEGKKTSVNGSTWSSMLALLLFCDVESLEPFLNKHSLDHLDRGRTALGSSLFVM